MFSKRQVLVNAAPLENDAPSGTDTSETYCAQSQCESAKALDGVCENNKLITKTALKSLRQDMGHSFIGKDQSITIIAQTLLFYIKIIPAQPDKINATFVMEQP
jgi:hypothetical protein